jgi:hypothetical protein
MNDENRTREGGTVNKSQQAADILQLNLNAAARIGVRLTEVFPVRETPDRVPTIPAEYADDIADQITAVVAEIIQQYLDAGSERENTMEELGPVIADHVKSWSSETIHDDLA